MDRGADIARRQVDAERARALGKPDRVGRRRAEDGRLELDHRPQTLLGRHRAAWNHDCAGSLGAAKRGPEADEWPKGKGEEDAIAGRHARRAIDMVGPDADPPIP